MKLRTTLSLSVGLGTLWLLGCGLQNVTNPPATETVAEATPLETAGTDPRFDSAGRVFLLHGVQPTSATQIHNVYVEDFIRRPNFGGGRMALPPDFVMTPPIWSELVAESQGDLQPQMKAAGQQPVSYEPVTETLKLPDGSTRSVRERVWLLREQYLLGVIADGAPTVYTIGTKGRHEALKAEVNKPKAEFSSKTAPKRPLDAFETDAIEKLRAGDETAFRVKGEELRVLGAIRARQECVSCHKVDVGTLLGAFTYTLKLQSEATPEADRLKDTAGLTDAELGAVQVVESFGGKVIRQPGGKVTGLLMSFARNEQTKANLTVWNGVTRLPLHDSALTILGAFPDVETLDVSHSLVSDAGLKSIATLKNLKKLDVSYSHATDAGVAALQKELPKCEIVRPVPLPAPQMVPPGAR